MDTFTSQSSSNSSPWSGQQPFLSFGFDQAKNNYLNNAPQYYPNQGFIDFSQPTVDALNGIQDVANQNQVGFGAAKETFDTLSGKYLNSNPYIDNVVDRVSGDIGSQVNSAFAKAGRYGSNAHADTLANSVADAASNLRYQNYGDERTNMMRGLAFAPQADQLQYSGFNNLLGAGSIIEGKQGEALQDDINRWNFDQNVPATHLNNYMSNVTGNYGGQTTSSQSQPVFGQSPVQGGIGGALAGSAIGGMLSDSPYAPWLGGASGGLLGLFS